MDSQLAKNFVTETVAIHPEMPWLDIQGRTLPDDILKIESKSWSEKTWDTYLKTVETPSSESLTSATSFQAALDSGNCINDFLATAAKPSTRAELRSALQQLTPRQSSIIKMTYWSGMSEREIASALGVSRSSVKTTKKRTLQKMHGLDVFKSTVLEFRTSAGIQE